MTETSKAYETVCTLDGKSKTYHTSGATKQEARDKAMVSANSDGYLDANCTTSEA